MFKWAPCISCVCVCVCLCVVLSSVFSFLLFCFVLFSFFTAGESLAREKRHKKKGRKETSVFDTERREREETVGGRNIITFFFLEGNKETKIWFFFVCIQINICLQQEKHYSM